MKKIAFIGEQCSGKTAFANRVATHFKNPKVVKFADPIYSVLMSLGQNKNRAFMQEFGDLAKRHFGEHIFANVFGCKVRDLCNLQQPYGEYYDILLCDDVRYKYEFDVASAEKFITVYIKVDRDVRIKRAAKLDLAFIDSHSSEASIPELKEYCDLVIDNSVEDKKHFDNNVSKIMNLIVAGYGHS